MAFEFYPARILIFTLEGRGERCVYFINFSNHLASAFCSLLSSSNSSRQAAIGRVVDLERAVSFDKFHLLSRLSVDNRESHISWSLKGQFICRPDNFSLPIIKTHPSEFWIVDCEFSSSQQLRLILRVVQTEENLPVDQ